MHVPAQHCAVGIVHRIREPAPAPGSSASRAQIAPRVSARRRESKENASSEAPAYTLVKPVLWMLIIRPTAEIFATASCTLNKGNPKLRKQAEEE